MKAVPEKSDSRMRCCKRGAGSSVLFRRLAAIFMPVLFLLYGTYSSTASATAGNAAPVSDSLRELFRDAAPHKAFFTLEKYLSGPNRTVFSEGSVLVFPGAGICWMAEKPRKQLWLITASGISDPDRYRVPESARGERPHPFFSKTMQAFTELISGRAADLEGGYDLSLSPGGDSSETVLRLLPRDPGVSRVIGEIVLTVADSRISGISIAETGGGHTRIRFMPAEDHSGFDPASGLEAMCHDR